MNQKSLKQLLTNIDVKFEPIDLEQCKLEMKLHSEELKRRCFLSTFMEVYKNSLEDIAWEFAEMNDRINNTVLKNPQHIHRFARLKGLCNFISRTLYTIDNENGLISRNLYVTRVAWCNEIDLIWNDAKELCDEFM